MLKIGNDIITSLKVQQRLKIDAVKHNRFYYTSQKIYFKHCSQSWCICKIPL